MAKKAFGFDEAAIPEKFAKGKKKPNFKAKGKKKFDPAAVFGKKGK